VSCVLQRLNQQRSQVTGRPAISAAQRGGRSPPEEVQRIRINANVSLTAVHAACCLRDRPGSLPRARCGVRYAVAGWKPDSS